MLEYIGSCRNVLEDPAFWGFASDATELAQLVDKGQKISLEEFLKFTGETLESLIRSNHLIKDSSFTVWSTPDKSIVWLYDEDYDVHHFWV